MARPPHDQGTRLVVSIVFCILLAQAILNALTGLVRLLLVVGACGAIGWIVAWTVRAVLAAVREHRDQTPRRPDPPR